MDNFFKSVQSLVQLKQFNKQNIEMALGLDLVQDKSASEKSGMLIYKEGANAILTPFRQAELRIFNANSNFFLLLYPNVGKPLNLKEWKMQFGSEQLIVEDKIRSLPGGYSFKTGNGKLCVYLNSSTKDISFVSFDGQINN